jgi:3-deoxy-7-phosphoheptulonate synthase
MFVAMKPHATQAEFDAVIDKVRALGLSPHPISGIERRVVAVVGNTGAVDPDDFAMLPGVAEALRVSQPFKLVSREVKEEDTVIDVGGVKVGGRPSWSWPAPARWSRGTRSSRPREP